MDLSTSSRRSLRIEMAKRRASLTPQEHSFLEELLVHGNEIEVQIATEKLMDDAIFFEASDDDGWRSSIIRMGRETSIRTHTSETSSRTVAEEDGSVPSTVQLLSADNVMTAGSELRQERLQTRKNSQLFGKIWRAHESGLAVSKTGSKRSVMRRSASLSGNKRTGLSQANDDIFRRNAPMKDSKSDNTRSMVRRSSMRRMTSDGSTRSRNLSVTFGALPPPRQPSQRVTSDDSSAYSATALRKAAPVRSDSVTSVASALRELQHPNPVRADSIGSIPSLHHGHEVHSPTHSIPSLHHAHSIRSGSLRNEVSSWDPFSASEATIPDQQAAWEAPVPVKVVVPVEDPIRPSTQVLRHPDQLERPVFMRESSIRSGEGIEVADWHDAIAMGMQKEPLTLARRHDSMVSVGDMSVPVSRSSSFDETMSFGRLNSIFRRPIPRSLSDEDMSGVFLGGKRLLHHEQTSVRELKPITSDQSWNIDDESEYDYYDSWKVIEDEYENGYGGGGTLPFHILGTSGDDVDAHPHVLSPPLMESLLAFVPPSLSADNLWMKYSMVRDGASWHSFLQAARGAKHTFLAIETVEGEVFGSFTSDPWRKSWNYFGGSEAFLWRMRHTRREKTHSIIDQAQLESEIEVFPYTGANSSIQLCTHEMLGVGGGTSDDNGNNTMADGKRLQQHNFGFGLTIEGDLLHGTSSPCLTFGSPSLSTSHPNGEKFEIINVELWTLTPCIRLEDAEKLEIGKLFLEKHLKGQ